MPLITIEKLLKLVGKLMKNKFLDELIKQFRDFFQGRQNAFAEQTEDGRYIKVDNNITNKHIIDHLSGLKTYAMYLINPNEQRCWHTVIDIDAEDNHILQTLVNACNKIGIKSNQLLIEFSGNKGFHIWLRYEQAIDAKKAQSIGNIIIQSTDIPDEVKRIIEIFPKQEKVDKSSYGNAIKLPLCKHKKSKKSSYFIDSELNRIENGIEELEMIKFISEEEVEFILTEFGEYLNDKKNDEAKVKENKENRKYCDIFPPCINSILEKGIDEGRRNKVAFLLTQHLNKHGFLEDVTKNILNYWNTKNKPPLPTKEMENVIKSVSKNDYNYKLCGNELIKDFCFPNCPKNKKNTSSQFSDPITVKDILEKEYPNKESYWGDSIIDPKSNVMITGRGKIGKSNFVLNLAIALASGTEFLGIPVSCPLTTLYLQQEISEKNLQKRLKLITNGKDISNLFCSTIKGLNLGNREHIKQIKKWLDDREYEIVIFDPLYKFHSNDENSAQEMKKITDIFDSLIADHGITNIIIHHHKKPQEVSKNNSDQISGSHVLFDWGDSYIRLNLASKKKSDIKVDFELRNAEEPEPIIIRMNESLRFEIISAGKKSDDMNKVLSLFDDSKDEWLTQKELCENGHKKLGISQSTVRNKLEKAEKQMLVNGKTEGNKKLWKRL